MEKYVTSTEWDKAPRAFWPSRKTGWESARCADGQENSVALGAPSLTSAYASYIFTMYGEPSLRLREKQCLGRATIERARGRLGSIW